MSKFKDYLDLKAKGYINDLFKIPQSRSDELFEICNGIYHKGDNWVAIFEEAIEHALNMQEFLLIVNILGYIGGTHYPADVEVVFPVEIDLNKMMGLKEKQRWN